MRYCLKLITAGIILLMLIPFSAFTAVITHTVKEGESLTGIAKKYYGSDDRYIILAEYNSLPHPKKIDVGQKITIPRSFKYKIKKATA